MSLDRPWFVTHVEHFVPALWNFTADELVFADTCLCGSELNEKHQCLALIEKQKRRKADVGEMR
jgi:hypothetical protein